MIMGAEVGMLIVETIAKIRRAFFVHGKSIKAICRELRSLTEGRTGGYPIGRETLSDQQWRYSAVFGDPVTVAAIDRLVHHATVLELNTESYRRRAALRKSAKAEAA